MTSIVEKRIVVSLKYLVQSGEKLLDSEEYASQMNEFCKYAESVKEYILENSTDRYIKTELSNMPKPVIRDSVFSLLSFVPYVSTQGNVESENNIRSIISIANNVRNHILYGDIKN